MKLYPITKLLDAILSCNTCTHLRGSDFAVALLVSVNCIKRTSKPGTSVKLIPNIYHLKELDKPKNMSRKSRTNTTFRIN